MVSAVRLADAVERQVSLAVCILKNLSVFDVRNNRVAVTVDKCHGKLVCNECGNTVNRMLAVCQKRGNGESVRVDQLLPSAAVVKRSTDTKSHRAGQQIHNGCIEVQDRHTVRITRCEIDTVQTTAAHTNGNELVRQSVFFFQIVGKPHAGIVVNVTAPAVLVFHIGKVEAVFKQFTLKLRKRTKVFHLACPMTCAESFVFRENENCAAVFKGEVQALEAVPI